jgi:gliding motility-associated-like protein
MTGFSGGSCPEYDTLTFTLTVGQEPRFTILKPGDTQMCKGEVITLALQPHSHFEVTPSAGTGLNANQSMLSFSPAMTTTYVLTGYNAGTCPSWDTATVTILVNPSPDAAFTVNPGVTYLDNPVFTLTNNSTGADAYEWYRNGGNLFSTSTSPIVSENAVGKYCYKLVAITNAGCIDSVTACGEILNNEKVFFPDAFSPNGDGHNDVFRPVLINIDYSLIKGFSLIIVNRYGEVMYTSVHPGDGWDGMWRGMTCDLGTYFYLCKFTTPQGKTYDVKGDLSLIY